MHANGRALLLICAFPSQVWLEAEKLKDVFASVDNDLVAANLQRLQVAMRKARIGPHHFAGSTGYGHGDLGRAALDEVSSSSSDTALYKSASCCQVLALL